MPNSKHKIFTNLLLQQFGKKKKRLGLFSRVLSIILQRHITTIPYSMKHLIEVNSDTLHGFSVIKKRTKSVWMKVFDRFFYCMKPRKLACVLLQCLSVRS